MLNSRVATHIASCTNCKGATAELAKTHAQLKEHGRTATDLGLSGAERRTFGRRRSLADRVSLQVAILEEQNRRRRRVGTQLVLTMASLAMIGVFLASPTPAREWIYRQILQQAPPPKVVVVYVAPAPKVIHIASRDPFAVKLPKTLALKKAAKPIVASSMPPPPPSLDAPYPTSPTYATNTLASSATDSSSGASDSTPSVVHSSTAADTTINGDVSPNDTQTPTVAPANGDETIHHHHVKVTPSFAASYDRH